MSEKWREVVVGKVEADITTYWLLAKMGFTATKLWNTALWESRQEWANVGRIPSGYALQKMIQGSYRYRSLQSHAAQKTIHEVGEAYLSWFKLRKKDPTAQPPGFRKKFRLSPVTFDQSGFRIEKGTGRLLLSVGDELRTATAYPLKFLPLKVKWWREPKGEFVEVRIVPRDGFFEVHAVEKLPEPKWRTEGTIRAVDLGVRNPVAIASENGTVEVYRGGGVLATLRYWNKEKGRVQGEVMSRSKGKKEWSRKLARMARHGQRQVRQAVNALTSAVTESCAKENVKEVLVGELKGIKKDKQTGQGKGWNAKSGQKLNQVPMREIVRQLRYKLARSGIRVREVDESYTSKGRCSACGCEDRTKLRRVHRGMFRCEACGVEQHADANGSRNILHKYLHQLGVSPGEGSSGRLASPLIRRWDGHRWTVVG